MVLIYVIVVNIGFATTLSYRYRDKLNFKYKVLSKDIPEEVEEKKRLFEKVKFADKLQFWLFYLGLYKDHRKYEQNLFYIPFALIGIMLVIER